MPGEKLLWDRGGDGRVFQALHVRAGQRPHEQIQETKSLTGGKEIKDPVIQAVEGPEEDHLILDHATEIIKAAKTLVQGQKPQKVLRGPITDEIKGRIVEKDQVIEKNEITSGQTIVILATTVGKV